jgi:hypothetical protein
MQIYFLILAVLFAVSAAFHFLKSSFVDSVLGRRTVIRWIGWTLVALGLWGVSLQDQRAILAGALLLASGAWRAFAPDQSIRFQQRSYPRWVHGLLLAAGGLICVYFSR